MSQSFEDQYFDVLRAIEVAIYETYKQHPDLVDFQTEKVLDALERGYTAEQRARRSPRVRLNDTEQVLFNRVEQVCELHLGRDPDVDIGDEAIAVDEIIACLRRIKRSVDQMGGKGRQAYLNFLDTFFSDK